MSQTSGPEPSGGDRVSGSGLPDNADLAGPRPRRAFIFLGVLLAAVLGVGLFTHIGQNTKTSAPSVGKAVPTFTATRLNGSGSVQVSGGGSSNGDPTVILFFGKWCQLCHTELPPLAAEIHQQDRPGGKLAGINFVGVDSEDTQPNAKAFIKSTGVTFPVGYDPNLDITSGDFYFVGDPYAVFVNGDGVITRIHGSTMTPAQLVAWATALTPSGS
jgi:thiol-disulfide isomerase/thioredoxin